MTPALRKIHRYIWFGLALILPAVWTAAILVTANGVWQQPLRFAQAEALPVLIQSKQSGDLVFQVRQDENGAHRQLEVMIQKPLDVANATIIAETEPEITLGLLGTRGIWRFSLDRLPPSASPLRLRVEDKIEQKVLYRIVL